ncbi:iron-sulfur cluster-binding oxidoreductase [Syntrophotalea carbinolica DSM 2380]|uniref:Iron-sulfur cluster-binding oxidoreductase n=1 Tax=Syntrophotalea carbinolica (strain DSM 2380 / NBRC 103641 / GraBd1) TaxID=338963 RepID=Q3A5N7_SYNC1|nr:4Fe-4S binding protein [Syntrophotalea carbinolica]ABA88320.1 iron-sulfur cluster-binding oxidoreductase [Syntrophotalea carbinolica DSM 2380]
MKSFITMWLALLLLSIGHVSVSASVDVTVDPEMTFAELAHACNLRGGVLADALGLDRPIDKQLSLRELGVTDKAVQDLLSSGVALEPLSSEPLMRGRGRGKGRGHNPNAEDAEGASRGDGRHRETQAVPDLYNYLLWPVLLGGVLWWLLRGGRFERGCPLPVAKRYSPLAFHATLALVVLFFGFASGKSPNPMEGLVKFVKALAGFYDDPWIKLGFLLFFTLMALLGSKLICGWGCPFGALQELVYDLPLLRRYKNLRLPFLFTMTVRTLIFASFLIIVSGVTGTRWVLYHGLNPFNLFGFEFSQVSIGIAVAVSLLLSLVIYRPFCQLVCPFGWYAWFLEKISLTGVRIDSQICVDCGACDRACPVEAAKDRLAGKKWPAECFSCARCLRVCPVDAIDYGPRWRQKSGAGSAEVKK